MRAIIIGGGIGGLAAAVALGRLGIECRILERGRQSAGSEEAGSGLSLWSNAVRILREFGLEGQALAAGSVIERTVTMTRAGRILAESDIAAFGREAGAASICVPRASLHQILSLLLPTGAVRYHSQCVSYAVRGEEVIAHIADGTVVRGDMLIGADGIHSAVRLQVQGKPQGRVQPTAKSPARVRESDRNGQPRYAGYTCWRGLAPGAWLPPGRAVVALGRGMQIGLFPCGPLQSYWFATCNAPPRAALDLTPLIEGWPEPIREAILATPVHAVVRNDIIDRPPSRIWGAGPVTLLGDAAHPSTPNLGQGACQALEDAHALALCLHNGGAINGCLRAWETARMARTAMVTNESWRLGRLLQSENPFVMMLRDSVTSSPLGRYMANKLLRQLLCAC